MTFGPQGAARPIATLVLRLWLADKTRQSQAIHLQATHVQTGEVAYFRTIEGVAQHIERLAQALLQPPVDLSEVRRRSDHD